MHIGLIYCCENFCRLPYKFCLVLLAYTDCLYLADRTNGRVIGTVLRPSVCRVCDVMYCG